jgi:hypothetical protein
MLIQAYRVESRRVRTADGIPLTAVSVGIVQLTGDSDEGKDGKRKKAAAELLRNHSPLVFHLVYGPSTWHAELVSVDDDSLGTPFFEDDASLLVHRAAFPRNWLLGSSRHHSLLLAVF